jgi:Protein of unknown function (DUF1573)
LTEILFSMKNFFVTGCFLLASLAAVAQKPSRDRADDPQANPQAAQQTTTTPAAPTPDPDAPKFKFKHGDTHDFGEVPEGPDAEYEFEFKNEGKKPLVISEAHGSCGCTVPEWSKEPVMPGKKSAIKVKYHTQGRVGPIHKDVFIKSNAEPDTYVLHITGTVKAADKAEKKN